jgi:hypothetical protein
MPEFGPIYRHAPRAVPSGISQPMHANSALSQMASKLMKDGSAQHRIVAFNQPHTPIHLSSSVSSFVIASQFIIDVSGGLLTVARRQSSHFARIGMLDVGHW